MLNEPTVGDLCFLRASAFWARTRPLRISSYPWIYLGKKTETTYGSYYLAHVFVAPNGQTVDLPSTTFVTSIISSIDDSVTAP